MTFTIRFLVWSFLFGGILQAAEPIDFARDIQPILVAKCTECHGGVKAAGGVSFIYEDEVISAEGKSGAIVVKPGDPEASEMFYRVTTADADDLMPPPEDHPVGLTPAEVKVLKQWIEEGAHWGQHWAFRTPTLPQLPAVSKADWATREMDRFVLARLEMEKLEPAADAPDSRWMRRTSLDLIGLPPTLEDVRSFDGNREAYVDKLLASPRYGERWASVWLDQVRYADSKGLGQDGDRQVWKYRDWVIDAFNDDMPYDQFTIKQIAGDLLPEATMEDLVATTVHRLTATNEEGGTDDEEFRVEAVLDRLSTTMQAWQGITIGCVQCHSHPYDPIQHDEYYQLVDFFNNTADVDLSEEFPLVQVPHDPAQYAKARSLDLELEKLDHAIWEREYAALAEDDHWTPLVDLRVGSDRATQFVTRQFGNEEHFMTDGTLTNNTSALISAPLPKHLKTLTAVKFTGMPQNLEKARSDAEWGFVLSHIEAKIVPKEGESIPLTFARVFADQADPLLDPQQSLIEKSKNGFGAYTKIHYPRSAAFVLESPVSIPEGATIELVLQHRINLLGSFALITKRGSLSLTDAPVFTELLSDPAIAQLQSERAVKMAERTKIPSVAIPVMKERPAEFARPTHVFERGLFLTKGDAVSAGTPASMPPLPDDGTTVNRLTLAKWLVASENPLTARVAVNRAWAQIFGTGLVAMEEDFGSSGEKPSHPELLDYLAVKFQTDWGWSQKRLVKELVLSRTYGQSSIIRPELSERDSHNRLLARGPRHRLPAETIRDQALFIGGILSEKMHGKPARPPLPDGVWAPFKGNEKWETPKLGDADRYRRAVYTHAKRSIPYPLFAAFDAPSREFCNPRRLRSNTPLQALMTLNDLTFQDAAAAFAQHLESLSGTTEDKIREGFLAVTAREPSESEIAKILYLLEATDWTETAMVLLNLDEALTK